MIQPVGNILTQLCQEMKKILDSCLINKHSIIANGAKLHVWLMCSCHQGVTVGEVHTSGLNFLSRCYNCRGAWRKALSDL